MAYQLSFSNADTGTMACQVKRKHDMLTGSRIVKVSETYFGVRTLGGVQPPAQCKHGYFLPERLEGLGWQVCEGCPAVQHGAIPILVPFLKFNTCDVGSRCMNALQGYLMRSAVKE